LDNKAIEVTLATSSPKGGAVYATNSTFYVADSEFENNQVEGQGGPRGGAVFVTAPTSDAVLVERSAFLGNSALDPSTDPNQARGGAIVIDQETSTSTATLRNNTFSGNSADEGGAIYNQRDGTTAGHDLDLEYCTFVENNADIASVLLTDVIGDVTFYNSVIHEPPFPTSDPCSGPAGSIVTGDGNYLNRTSYTASMSATCDFNAGMGDAAGFFSVIALNYHGAPTQIHRLSSVHPALGLAPCLSTVAEDQHGAPRATSGACDSGSWEAP
jgi:hypothetical protein